MNSSESVRIKAEFERLLKLSTGGPHKRKPYQWVCTECGTKFYSKQALSAHVQATKHVVKASAFKSLLDHSTILSSEIKQLLYKQAIRNVCYQNIKVLRQVEDTNPTVQAALTETRDARYRDQFLTTHKYPTLKVLNN